MIIAEIAARQLRHETAAKVEALVVLLDRSFNEDQPYNIITAGAWMDDMRRAPNYSWGPWHYINLPCESGPGLPVEPEPPHALWALDHAVGILRSGTAAPNDRAEALAQVMHIVGDIHQPLHASDRADCGGNGVLLAPFGAHNHSPKTLHSFWDASYRFDAQAGAVVECWQALHKGERPAGPRALGPIAATASALLTKYPFAPEPAADFRAWVTESHRFGCESGWPAGPHPTDHEVIALSPAFVAKAHGIAEKRLVQAGFRLARLLEMLFSEKGAR